MGHFQKSQKCQRKVGFEASISYFCVFLCIPEQKNQFENILNAFFAGFKDACSIHLTLPFFLSSSTIRTISGKCFFFNAVIFLGSYILMAYIISPIFLFVGSTLFSGNYSWLFKIAEQIMQWIYYVWIFLWIRKFLCFLFFSIDVVAIFFFGLVV